MLVPGAMRDRASPNEPRAKPIVEGYSAMEEVFAGLKREKRKKKEKRAIQTSAYISTREKKKKKTCCNFLTK